MIVNNTHPMNATMTQTQHKSQTLTVFITSDTILFMYNSVDALSPFSCLVVGPVSPSNGTLEEDVTWN